MRYIFENHKSKPNWYTVTDTKWNLVCHFEEHLFNETHTFEKAPHNEELEANLPQIMKELGDWLFLHREKETIPTPKVEFRLSDDDTKAYVIRHKDPKFILVTDAKDVNTLPIHLGLSGKTFKKMLILGLLREEHELQKICPNSYPTPQYK